ncbi:MAG TPA: SulP family inorganic anion transporter [Actinomycetota bacterium]
MSEQPRTAGWPTTIAAGVIIGAVEAFLAVSFAALVFGGYLEDFIPDGIALYLGAAALTLAIFAWRAGTRGVVGGMQAATAAVIAIVAASTAVGTFGSPERAFLTVVAATLAVTVLSGAIFLVLGMLRRGNLIRFVPYPVVGGFLAGAGWLLLKGGIYVASGESPSTSTIGDLTDSTVLQLWLPALAFGVILLIATRLVKRPLVIPAVLGIGLVLFVIGMLVTGSSIESARGGNWLLLSVFDEAQPWEPWTLRAVTGADWLAVLEQWAGIAAAVFIAVVVILFNISETELVLHRDLDTNQELRDAGVLNVVSGAVGGIPAYHALNMSGLGEDMKVNARRAGLIAALVPLAAVLFGASVIELIPRMIVGGVLVFLGLAYIVEWVWDRRRSLPAVEFGVVLVILAAFIVRGLIPGVVIGLVLAIVLFAVSYGRIELVREVAFGDTYHSNVDRPPGQRAVLRSMGDRVHILRVNGFVFFGSANSLLERIRKRVEAGPPRFLVVDLRRVTGVDSSAVMSFVKVVHLAQSNGFELVFTGASDPVRKQLERGGVVEAEGIVRFEPDLDRGLQLSEEGLLRVARPDGAEVEDDAARDGAVDAAAERVTAPDGSSAALAGMPAGLGTHLERVTLSEGTVLIRQDEPPDDVFVLEEGRLSVEMVTGEGTRLRLRSVNPGVVVGEVSMYTGLPRTADVVAETPSVVLRLSGATIRRIEADEPELAAAMHRWLARTLSERLTDTLREFDALLD